jgi:3-oxoacyl-[acyl-carrier protein] reductase
MSSTTNPEIGRVATILVGQQASFRSTITLETIEAFAALSGDRNPLHVDPDYASKTAFGGQIAHGMIAGALISQLIGMHLPGERALYRSQSLCFLGPIRPGTEVEVRGEVTAVDPELSLIRIRTEVVSVEEDQCLVEGEGEVVVRGGLAMVAPTPKDIQEDPSPALPARPSMQRKPTAGSGPLHGERVLVVGGSRGIGAAIARNLGAAGADVLLTYLKDRAAAEQVELEVRGAGGRAEARALDLADPEEVVRTLAAWDEVEPLTAVVLCAHGEILRRSLLRSSFADLEAAFRRSVGGLHAVVRGVGPGMRARRRGSIVALSSSVTQEVPPPGWGAYTAAKSGLEGLIRTLAVELAPAGIRVNAVVPSLTETESVLAGPSRVRDELAARSPLGRLARPEDVAAAVRFLVGPGSEYLTGVRLPVTGGAVMS